MNRAARASVLCVACALAAGCAAGPTPPPRSLLDARESYALTRDGAASQLDPSDLQEAQAALQRAEEAWRRAPRDPRSLDLAVIAQRKALIARANAGRIASEQDARRDRARLDSAREPRESPNSATPPEGRSQMQGTPPAGGRTK